MRVKDSSARLLLLAASFCAGYTEELYWTKGNSHVFTGAAFFQLLRGDQNTFPLLDMFLHATSDPAVMSLDLRNSVEIISDSPDTYRHIVSGTARLTTAR